MATPFETFLVTPEREVWSGQATIVIARGSEGELGIMNGHAPMLIQLAIGPLFIEPVEGERIAAAVDGGFLHVVTGEGETRVDILAEHDGPAGCARTPNAASRPITTPRPWPTWPRPSPASTSRADPDPFARFQPNPVRSDP